MPKQIVTPYMASQPTALAVLGRRVDTMVGFTTILPRCSCSVLYTAPASSINLHGALHKSNLRPVKCRYRYRVVITLLTPDTRPTLQNTNNCCRGRVEHWLRPENAE